MLHMEGEKQFARPRPVLWSKLDDLGFLVQCIPDLSKVHEVKDRSAKVTVRPGLAFIRGTIDLIIEKQEETPPESARLMFKGKSIGASNEVEVLFRLEEKDGGTLLKWTADVKHLGGLLKLVPSSLIQGAAGKVINEMMTKIEAAV